MPVKVIDDRIILDKTVADQVSMWKSSRGLTDKAFMDHACSGETCSYYQIGDVFLCEKTGHIHGRRHYKIIWMYLYIYIYIDGVLIMCIWINLVLIDCILLALSFQYVMIHAEKLLWILRMSCGSVLYLGTVSIGCYHPVKWNRILWVNLSCFQLFKFDTIHYPLYKLSLWNSLV